MILYYDCFSGISGDMNLAAMIDLGVEPDYLRAELSKLGLEQEFELKISEDARGGICGTRVDVQLRSSHEHRHAHGHSGHSEHGHSHAHHRNLQDILDIITGSGLSEEVQGTSIDIFQKVAEAEAHVHGKPMEEVHFHEVGAIDSIVDIVGAAICYHRLDVDAIWASPVELGGGFVQCAHGIMPVPAPATVEILHGIPTTRGRVKHETTTPTGAAILASLVNIFTDAPYMTTCRTGYGIGHRIMEVPNMLRVYLATTEKINLPDKKRGRTEYHCVGNLVEMPGTTMNQAGGRMA